MGSSGPSLVRTAGLGPWPDNELVALAGAAARWFGRFGGIACEQSWYQQLRPTGRGLQKSDLEALGRSGGEEIRRNFPRRYYLSERFKPVLAAARTVRFEEQPDANDSAARQDHDDLQ